LAPSLAPSLSQIGVALFSADEFSPNPSLAPSSSPVAPSITINTLFKPACSTNCWTTVALHEDKAVVARGGYSDSANYDVRFYASANSSFELVTELDVDYTPYAVDINGDTAVIGNPFENYTTGTAYVYERDQNGTWSQALQIQPGDLDDAAWFGESVAIDGNIMVVGASDDGQHGSVYVYRRNGTAWREAAKLTPDDPAAGDFGMSVSVKDTSIVVGAPTSGGGQEGAIFVYDFDPLADSWSRVGRPVQNSDCKIYFGNTVQLMDDKGLLASCWWIEPHEPVGVDKFYYYDKHETGEDYVLQHHFDFEYETDSFAVNGNVMFVRESNWLEPNAVHFFVLKNGVWEQAGTIDELTSDEEFGN